MADIISFPSLLVGFHQNISSIETRISRSGRLNHFLSGEYHIQEGHRICSKCNNTAHVHGSAQIHLSHIPLGNELSTLTFERMRFKCPCCGSTWMQDVPFKAKGHFITVQLETYAHDLLEKGLSNKMVCSITGLGRNTVKDIDMKRLGGLYTQVGTDGKRHLLKPERQTTAIAVDEIKIHEGPVFITVIIDLETGHILWIAHGKKKKAILDFIEHVGKDWFDTVEAVACDMNSDYQEVFEDEFDHIQVVFDHFHIIKNFNEKVVAEVRKDEQRRLTREGNIEAAKALKKTRYILLSKRETLQKKDQAAINGKIIVHEGNLFPRSEKLAMGNKEQKYDDLIRENELLFKLDLIKQALDEAYRSRDEIEMTELISNIIDICQKTGNKHFQWFARLLLNHFEGIIAHASLPYSTGRLEGLNNKAKQVMRQAYGYRDDEYFFLKLIDSSRHSQRGNQKSHRKSD